MPPPTLTLAVVDDHHLMRPGLMGTVGGWPHALRVVGAEDGLDYERLCAEVGHIHIAIIDRQMPRRDGFDTLRWAARHQPRTRCILISFELTPADVRLAIRLGARAVLRKDVHPEELYKALTAVHTHGYYYNALMDADMRRSVEDELAHRDPDKLWASLSPREREVVLLYASPHVKDLKDVAQRLGMACDTAETHRRKAYRKLGCSTKTELVHLMRENGWK